MLLELLLLRWYSSFLTQDPHTRRCQLCFLLHPLTRICQRRLPTVMLPTRLLNLLPGNHHPHTGLSESARPSSDMPLTLTQGLVREGITAPGRPVLLGRNQDAQEKDRGARSTVLRTGESSSCRCRIAVRPCLNSSHSGLRFPR